MRNLAYNHTCVSKTLQYLFKFLKLWQELTLNNKKKPQQTP